MKFVVNGDEMTIAIKRVAATFPKRPVIPPIIKFETAEEAVSLTAVQANKRVSIRVPAFVVDPGAVAVNVDDASLICGLNHDVTYEDDGKKLTAANQKKRRSTGLRDLGIIRDWNDYAFKPFGSIATPELMDAFKVTDGARSGDEHREVLTGFCLNTREMVTLDGFHLVLRKLNVQNAAHDGNLLLPGETYADMKNLIVNKKDGAVSIECCEKCIKLSCDDFTYEINPIAGEFIKYEQIIPKTYKLGIEASAKEMLGVAKEYSKYRGNRRDVEFLAIGSGITTMSLVTDSGYLADKLECCAVSAVNVDYDDSLFLFAHNIKYMLDVLNAMDEDKMRVTFNSIVSPATFATEKTTALLLPIRVNDGGANELNVDGMLEFMKPMRETLQIPA